MHSFPTVVASRERGRVESPAGGGGGGGGTQMVFGRGCEAEASKPVPIFKGHFAKRVPIIRDFPEKVTLSRKVGACLGIFQLKTGTHV